MQEANQRHCPQHQGGVRDSVGEFQKNVDSYEDDEADEHPHHQPCDSDERPGLAAVGVGGGGGAMRGGTRGATDAATRDHIYMHMYVYIYIYIYIYVT